MKAPHLVRRFFVSVTAAPPSAEEREWVAGLLGPGEMTLWDRQPRYDQRHTIATARTVEERLRDTAYAGDPRWVVAALLHDIGKLEAELGIAGRVAGTLVAMAFGVRRVAGWKDGRGLVGRFGRYMAHGSIGATMIRDAGGSEEAAQWAEVHHLKRGTRTAGLPADLFEVLRTSDR